MGLLSRLKWALFPKIDLKSSSSFKTYTWSETIDKTWLARDAAVEGYAKNAIVYHCISQRAKAFASVPYKLFRKKKNGEKIEILDHPLLTLLNRPNPINSRTTFLENYLGFYALSGNTFVELVLGRTDVKELWIRSTLEMGLEVGATSDIPQRYIRTKNGLEKKFEVDPVTGDSLISHMKNFNPNNQFIGISPLSAAALSIKAINDAKAWNNTLLYNRGRPEGILRLKGTDYNLGGTLSDPQREQLKKLVSDEYSGQNAGGLFILPGDLEYQQLTLTPLELDYINSNNVSAIDICLVEGYPAYMLGLPGTQSTFNNMGEAKLYFYENTVIPDVDNFTDKFNQDVASYFGDDLFIAADLDNVSALSVRREARWKAINEDIALSINEKREERGRTPVDGGDEILVGSMQVPLSQVGVVPEAPEDLPINEDDSENEDEEEEASKEFKALNLNSDHAKKNYSLSVQRRKLAHERRLKFQVERHLKGELELVLKKIKGLPESEMESAIEKALKITMPDLSNILEKNYRLILEDFGGDVLNAFKGDPKVFEKKDAVELFNDFSSRWIKEQLPKRLGYIWNATDKKLNQVVQRSISELLEEDESLDHNKLAHKIREKYSPMSNTRALRIARTETSIAAAEGSLGAAKEISMASNVALLKEWVSVNDDRTRDSHAAMNGIEAELESDFNVNGNQMSGPGDPDAPIEEVINCRCTLTYKTR